MPTRLVVADTGSRGLNKPAHTATAEKETEMLDRDKLAESQLETVVEFIEENPMTRQTLLTRWRRLKFGPGSHASLDEPDTTEELALVMTEQEYVEAWLAWEGVIGYAGAIQMLVKTAAEAAQIDEKKAEEQRRLKVIANICEKISVDRAEALSDMSTLMTKSTDDVWPCDEESTLRMKLLDLDQSYKALQKLDPGNDYLFR